MRSEGTQPRAGQAAEHEQAATNGSKCAGVRRVLGDAGSEIVADLMCSCQLGSTFAAE